MKNVKNLTIFDNSNKNNYKRSLWVGIIYKA